jgi:hypothetical protein
MGICLQYTTWARGECYESMPKVLQGGKDGQGVGVQAARTYKPRSSAPRMSKPPATASAAMA